MQTAKNIIVTCAVLLVPVTCGAQADGGMAAQVQSLQGVLDTLYEQMIPLSGNLLGVARGIAGFAALWYIASRVFRSLAAAEPIDVYPLLRPFALGLCILMYPAVLGLLNGLLQPVVRGTAAMADRSDAAVQALLDAEAARAEKTQDWQMYTGVSGDGDPEGWYGYSHPDEAPGEQGIFQGLADGLRFRMAEASYRFRGSVKRWMSEVLQVLFQAAALCINALRTFNLIVLAILGPLVFGLSVFDGFRDALSRWLARYVNVFLWLPVANIFGALIGKIQQSMLKLDLSQLASTGQTYFSPTDVAYLIFLIMAILGYFSVPTVASHIVQAGTTGLKGRLPVLAAGTVTSFIRPGPVSPPSPGYPGEGNSGPP